MIVKNDALNTERTDSGGYWRSGVGKLEVFILVLR